MPETLIASRQFCCCAHQPLAARPRIRWPRVAAAGAVSPGSASAGRGLRLPRLQGHRFDQLGVPDSDPKTAVGESGGGMANAIAGSASFLLIASCMGVPIGNRRRNLSGGIRRGNRFGNVIRFTADVLNGVPSIVVGIVAYGIVVLSQGHFSALAGGVALAIMMIPTITRTTEEMLLLVPQTYARGSLRTGRFPLAHDSFDYPAHRHLRRDYRCYAGICPGRGRDRASAVHGISATSTGTGTLTSPRPRCRCRFLLMPFRPSMSGTARRGRAR